MNTHIGIKSLKFTLKMIKTGITRFHVTFAEWFKSSVGGSISLSLSLHHHSLLHLNHHLALVTVETSTANGRKGVEDIPRVAVATDRDCFHVLNDKAFYLQIFYLLFHYLLLMSFMFFYVLVIYFTDLQFMSSCYFSQ